MRTLTNEEREEIIVLSVRMAEYARVDARRVARVRVDDYLACASLLREIADAKITMSQVLQRAETVQAVWDRPEHYGGEENPFEPIKVIEHYDLNFNLGNVIKYTLRAPFKGTALADLKKAYTYIGFEIRKQERAGETE